MRRNPIDIERDAQIEAEREWLQEGSDQAEYESDDSYVTEEEQAEEQRETP